MDGVIKDRGVLMPNRKSIYEPVLKLLEENGIKCNETVEWKKYFFIFKKIILYFLLLRKSIEIFFFILIITYF